MAGDIVPTELLLLRAGEGDRAAMEALYERYLPRLRRWAAGRLPTHARDLSDTHDLVQETLMHAFPHLNTFECRGEGAFLAYLRRAILNRINNEMRRVSRKPVPASIPDGYASRDPSPLEGMLGRDALNRYEHALQQLSESDRHAIIGRIEFGCSYEELVSILGKENRAAARKALERAIKRLAAAMQHER